MACPTCGSWAVRADRSLGGRMVCARCGQPLGIGAQRRTARVVISRPGRRGLWLGVAALVLVSAVLAWRAERPPAPGRGVRMPGAEAVRLPPGAARPPG